MKKFSILLAVLILLTVSVSVFADFSDDFSSPDFKQNGWDPFVYLGNPNGNFFFPERNRLSFHLPAVDTYIYMPNENTFSSDAEAEATFENAFSTHASVGLICRWHDYGWYEFRVWTSGPEAGSYAVYKFDEYLKSQNKQPFVVLHPGFDRINSNDIKLGIDSRNTLKMQCEGDKIRVFINGEEQFPISGGMITDSDFSDGLCGAAVQNYTEDVAQIDLLKFQYASMDQQ